MNAIPRTIFEVDPPPAFSSPPEPERKGGYLHFADVEYARADGFRPLLLDLDVPVAGLGSVGCVIYVHGGAFLVGSRRLLPPTMSSDAIRNAVLDRGLAYATVDYRLSGEAAFPAQIHDVKAAIRYLRHFANFFRIDASKFGAWGESAGGHLVALAGLDRTGELEGDLGVLGVSSEVTSVVDWYGLTDLSTILLSVSLEVRIALSGVLTRLLGATIEDNPDLAATASPVHYVNSTAVPFLLVHGDSDTIVPFEQSRVFARLLLEAGGDVHLERVVGADHCFIGSDRVAEIIGMSADFLAGHLKVGSHKDS